MTPQEMLDKIEATVRKHIDMCGYDFPEEHKLGEEALALIPQLRAALPQWRPINMLPPENQKVALLIEPLDSHKSFKEVDWRDVGYWTSFNGGGWVRNLAGTVIGWEHLPPTTPAPEGK